MSIFSKVAFRKPQQSRFNMTHGHKLTFNMGELVPFFCEETLPGDRWRLSTQMLTRMAPMIAPVMHEVNIYVHWFFVPNRIVWPEWNNFIYQTKPGYVPPVRPFLNLNDTAVPAVVGPGTLSNYLRMPVSGFGNEGVPVSALPFAGYQKIWNDYFRDENLEPELDCDLVDGDNGARREMYTTLRKRAWTKDYFTSALPWAQKGDAVTIPLANEFPDVDVYLNQPPGATSQNIFSPNNIVGRGNLSASMTTSTDGSQGTFEIENGGNYFDAILDPNGSLSANTSSLEVESTTIENLRVAVTMQEWLELAARGGTRPNEASLAFFGVKSSDGRLQRPDYLGGSMSPMVISEVLQTAQGSGDDPTPQGNMAGHGVAGVQGNYIDYFCEEHGHLYGIVSILPRPAYQQGLRRMFTREDKFDYAWPQFANLGEQAVLNKEIYLNDDDLNDGVFGYQSRYAEYKHIPDWVSGEFATTLDFWHMGRIFDSRPGLNGTFVAADPTHRIFAVDDEGEGDPSDKIWAIAKFNCSATRKLPKYGIPKFS